MNKKAKKKPQALKIKKETLRVLQGAGELPPKPDHSYAIICGAAQLAESAWCVPVQTTLR